MIAGKLYRAKRDMFLLGKSEFTQGEIMMCLNLKRDNLWTNEFILKFLDMHGRVREINFHVTELEQWFERV